MQALRKRAFLVSFLGLSVLCECVFLAVDLGFGIWDLDLEDP